MELREILQRRRMVRSYTGEADWVARGNEPWISVAPVHLFLLTREADCHEPLEELVRWERW